MSSGNRPGRTALKASRKMLQAFSRLAMRTLRDSPVPCAIASRSCREMTTWALSARFRRFPAFFAIVFTVVNEPLIGLARTPG